MISAAFEVTEACFFGGVRWPSGQCADSVTRRLLTLPESVVVSPG